MIRKLHRFVCKPVSLLLGVYMINLCVDSADFEGSYSAYANEIESVIELVYEIILDEPDFLPEQDEPDPESCSVISTLVYVISASTFELAPEEESNTDSETVFIPKSYPQPAFTIQSPPPDLHA